ncbi:MAG: sigma-70 family RNA polymerase sigma factor [bacterium]|nr:sigma-70 family RNA polymerase sigma factor [bacterium]
MPMDTWPRAPDPETKRLVRAAQAGDAESFSALYERIAPALSGWAALRIRPAFRTHFDPQDVVQEVWYRAWKSLGRYDADNVPFRSWVFRIAKNVLLEGIRRLREPDARDAAGGSETRLFALRNLPDSATAISQRLARDESVELFVDFVRGLDDEDRKLVIYCGLEGMTYREVADRLRLKRDAIAKRWQRLRARIETQVVPARLFADL